MRGTDNDIQRLSKLESPKEALLQRLVPEGLHPKSEDESSQATSCMELQPGLQFPGLSRSQDLTLAKVSVDWYGGPGHPAETRKISAFYFTSRGIPPNNYFIVIFL